MSCRCSRTGRNVVPEQQDRSKCRPGAAGQVEMSSGSSRTGRNVVPEQQDKSKCRPRAAGQVEMSSRSPQLSKSLKNKRSLKLRDLTFSVVFVFLFGLVTRDQTAYFFFLFFFLRHPVQGESSAVFTHDHTCADRVMGALH